MSFSVEVFPASEYEERAGRAVAEALPGAGSVVLTGGSTAQSIYRPLAARGADWSRLDVLFSDERCVPPDDAASNFGMARKLLLDPAGIERVYRMRGELDPEEAAERHDRDIRPLVARGLDLVLLGMGADCHIAGMFPGSPALSESEALCRAVDRPDGMRGLTLTPPALAAGKRFLIMVAGNTKAEAVQRAIHGREPVETCPAKLLWSSNATFLLDEPAAARLPK